MTKAYHMPKMSNYYGSLKFYKEDEKYFWGLDEGDGLDYHEIPEYLYRGLLKFYKEQND